MLNVKVHESTIRKRMNKYGLLSRVVRRKHLLSEKNMAAEHRFAKLHLNYKTSETMSFAQMRQKWRYLGIMHSSTLG